MKPPACKKCSRRGYVWQGPTRIPCPECLGSGSREAAPIVKEGEVGKEKRLARAEARAVYFLIHRTNNKDDALGVAPCQFCGEPMQEKTDRVDAAHKERRWKGDDSPENICAAHHVCHAWQSETPQAERELLDSSANVIVGGLVAWSKEMKKSLRKFKQASGAMQ